MKRKILLTISLLLVGVPFIINSYSLIRMVSLLCGIILITSLFKTHSKGNKLILIIIPLLLFICTYSIDYMLTCVFNHYPIYAIQKKSNEKLSTLHSLMYRVYDCNGKLYFDNHYKNLYMCSTSLLDDTDINKVLNEPKKYYKEHANRFVKITGKISKINGNSSIELRNYIIDEDKTLNGYVKFDETKKLEIKLNNKIDATSYKIFDYITVVGELKLINNHTLSLENVVIENNNLYSKYNISIIEPSSCGELKEYTEGYYTYCLSNIYIDYGIDKYELSYLLKDKKISFENLIKGYNSLEEEKNMDLYHLDKFDVLVCNKNKKIILNKKTNNPFNLCEVNIK